MNLYEEDLLPLVAEKLDYLPGTLSKIDKFVNEPIRESIHYRFKESCFWDYSEGKGWKVECNGHQYFDRIISKYVGKPFKHVIHKCRTHGSYKHCKGFKRQVDQEIRDVMKDPEMKCYTYPGSANLSGEYFVDMDGILRTIDQHPLYFIVPFVEKVAWRSWQDPTRITTSSRKLIHKIKGIHYFVPSFDQVKFYYKQPIHKNSRRILNPDFFQLPLTNSQLQQYHLVNDTAAH